MGMARGGGLGFRVEVLGLCDEEAQRPLPRGPQTLGHSKRWVTLPSLPVLRTLTCGSAPGLLRV